MTRELLLDLFDHMEWADAQVWSAALPHAPAAADAQLRQYLLHTAGVQKAFLDAWTGQPFVFRPTFDDTSIAAEFPAVRAYYPAARAYLSDVDGARLRTTFNVPWIKWVEQAIKRTPADTTLGETMVQVFLHTTHHRAQASARLRALGAEPPNVDYIAWLWLGRPQPSWLTVAT